MKYNFSPETTYKSEDLNFYAYSYFQTGKYMHTDRYGSKKVIFHKFLGENLQPISDFTFITSVKVRYI